MEEKLMYNSETKKKGTSPEDSGIWSGPSSSFARVHYVFVVIYVMFALAVMLEVLTITSKSCLKNEPGTMNLYSDHANPLKYSSRAVAAGKDCPCVLL